MIKEFLKDYNVKREIFRGNIEVLKNLILDSIREINDNKDYVYTPEFKNKEIWECDKCEILFLNKIDLENHYTICNNINIVKSSLNEDNLTKIKEYNNYIIQQNNLIIEQKNQNSIDDINDLLIKQNKLIQEQNNILIKTIDKLINKINTN